MYPRWLWPAVALPGIIWLTLLFLVPLYAVVGVAFGGVDPIFFNPVPFWNPLDWNVGYMNDVLDRLRPGGDLWHVYMRTIRYVVEAVAICLLIGYPVAYYIARHARRTKTLLLVLLILPFWISYLMRMLAWVNLLAYDGYVNRFLMWIGLLDQPRSWLAGQESSLVMALVYGYIPFMILPLYAALDRIDRSHIEAARDLGATPFRAFWHITMPLSKTGILGGMVLIALPMFGDYYTNDLISGSPKTSMIGNQIDLYFHGGPQPSIGAALTIVLSVVLTVLMVYYLVTVARASRGVAR